MGEELSILQMEMFTMVNIKTESHMVRDFIYGKMEQSTEANLKMV